MCVLLERCVPLGHRILVLIVRLGNIAPKEVLQAINVQLGHM